MADLPLATDEMRRQLALPPDRQYGIDPGEGNTRGYAFNQWLPLSTNRVGSPSWVQQGADPQLAVPQVAQGGLLGVAGMADAPRTGKLTPEALGSLLTGSTLGGGLLAPRGSLASGGSIKAYHGSPHDFDRFSFENIGTGEGAQAYGHGLYFAENEGVARGYRDQLSSPMFKTPDGTLFDPQSQLQHLNVRVAAHRNGTDLDASIARAQQLLPKASEQTRPMLEHDIAVLQSFKDKGGISTNPGHMYEVNINADPQKFLDWDKPLGQQSPDAQSILAPEVQRAIKQEVVSGYGDPLKTTGGDAYGALASLQPWAGGPRTDMAAASARLREAGIPGVRYLDQGSRGPSTVYNVGAPRSDFGPYSPFTTMEDAQKHLELLRSHGFSDAEIKQQAQPQTSNYVVFPTQDEIIKILRKYGLAAPSPVVPSPQGAQQTPGLLSSQQSEIPMQDRVY